MSRIGLAYTLAWYRLRTKVQNVITSEAMSHAVIDVWGLAEVLYGPNVLRWSINTKSGPLVYYFASVTSDNYIYMSGSKGSIICDPASGVCPDILGWSNE